MEIGYIEKYVKNVKNSSTEWQQLEIKNGLIFFEKE